MSTPVVAAAGAARWTVAQVENDHASHYEAESAPRTRFRMNQHHCHQEEYWRLVSELKGDEIELVESAVANSAALCGYSTT